MAENTPPCSPERQCAASGCERRRRLSPGQRARCFLVGGSCNFSDCPIYAASYFKDVLKGVISLMSDYFFLFSACFCVSFSSSFIIAMPGLHVSRFIFRDVFYFSLFLVRVSAPP